MFFYSKLGFNQSSTFLFPEGNVCAGEVKAYSVSGFLPNNIDFEVVNETVVSIESKTEELKFDANEEWELEIYDQSQNLKVKKQQVKGRTNKINTRGWKEGVYIVRAKYQDKVITGRLSANKQ